MRCIENFDITSEMLLGIEPFPPETCPHNYPISDYLESLHHYLGVLEKGGDVMLLDTDYEIYSAHGDELIQITSSFHAWVDDWLQFYNKYLQDNFTKTEQAYVEHCFVDIQNTFFATNITPLYVECAIHEISRLKGYIDENYEQFLGAIEEHDNKTSELSRTLNDIEYEIQRSDGDEFALMLEHRGGVLKSIKEHQQSTPVFDNFFDEVRQALDMYTEFFGGTAHRHFAALRYKMRHLKNMIKQYSKDVDNAHAQRIHKKPVAFLREIYQTKLNDETTLYCASPEVFIMRCQKMERDRPQLSFSDKGKLSGNCLSTAIKRLLIDYAEYENLVCFETLSHAITYGSHTSLDIRAYW